MAAPVGVHFMGSIPLTSTDQVFREIISALSNRLYTIPDGETGIRLNFIDWELLRFPKETWRPYLMGSKDLPEGHPGFTAESVEPTQYDRVALESYKRFSQLRDQGIIPPGVRFQISLPTPLAVIQGHLRPEFNTEFEPFYERRILDALNNIAARIPAHDLAIQWDLPFETLDLEWERGRLPPDYVFTPQFSPVLPGVMDRIGRLCAHVPPDALLGFHICYGNFGGNHLVEPENLGLAVEFANAIAAKIHPRTADWVHMPVPKRREDCEFFAPLRGLTMHEKDTRLILGLVHFEDEDGTRRRIRAAQEATGRQFSVATICGLGRLPTDQLGSILEIARKVTEPITV